MNNTGVNIRELATEIFLSIDKKEEHSHILLKNVLDKYDYIPQSDKNFIKRVVEGTLEYKIKIDYVLGLFSKTPVNKMKPFIRNLMRISVYQIMYMDKVPDSAVCNEAVKLAGKRGFRGLAGFVNGVLRTISREKDNISWPTGDDISSLSVNYSCPEIIVESLINDYGLELTKDILGASLLESRLYVRIDETLDADKKKEIFAEWDNNGIEYEKSDLLDYAYYIKKADRLFKLDGFVKGLYTIQDVSSMMVCEMAGIIPGDTIIDMCAAPGGKTCHAATKLKIGGPDKSGIVISRDVSEYKTGLIEENISRLSLDNVKVEVFDARVFDEKMEQKADLVIADVPCSGFGVIGKKPDIKYNVTPEGLDSLAALQREIIDNAVRYVKKGGRLMLSTCTMRKAENDMNVKYILSNKAFELANSRQLFLSEETDGFYIAKFIRK